MATYQEKISFDGKQWYLLEWDGIEFRKMDILFELKEYNTLEELLSTITEKYPDCEASITPIEAPKPKIEEKPKRRKKK